MSNYRNIDFEKLAQTLKALANPHRLAIFKRLLDCCGASCSGSEEQLTSCVGDLGDGLGIAPSTISHHIKELRYAGLIEVKKRGREVRCRLGGETLELLLDFFNRLQESRCGTPPDQEQNLSE
jgi:DNA-binding transcriptional ArsR family regulator